MNTATLTTFIIYLISIMALGVIAYRQTHNLADYMLGGRRLSSGVAAISARGFGYERLATVGFARGFVC